MQSSPSSKALTLLNKQQAIQAFREGNFSSPQQLAEHYGITRQGMAKIIAQQLRGFALR